MQAIMSSRQYSESTGYPLATVRQWCRQGVIPHHKIGRGYFIVAEEATLILKKKAMAEANVRSEVVNSVVVKPKFASNRMTFDEVLAKVDSQLGRKTSRCVKEEKHCG